MSRRGMQYSPAVPVRSMHSRSMVDYKTGDRGVPIRYRLIIGISKVSDEVSNPSALLGR